MKPENIKLFLDVIVILTGLYAMFMARRAAVGGFFGTAMNLILAGIFILTINHLLDTIFLANALKTAGHTADYLQGPIVHRVINLSGFLLMTIGFSVFSKSNTQ